MTLSSQDRSLAGLGRDAFKPELRGRPRLTHGPRDPRGGPPRPNAVLNASQRQRWRDESRTWMTAPRQMCSSPAWDRATIRLSLGQTALGGSRAKLIGDDILGFWLSSVAVLQQAFAFMTRGRPTQTGSGGASLTAEPLRRSAGPRAGVSGERGIDGEMNLRGCSILPRQEIPAIADTQRCRSRWFRQRDVAFTQRSSRGEDQRVSLSVSLAHEDKRASAGGTSD